MLQAPAFSRFRDTVTVWADDTLFYRFYPVPDVPRIRRGDDGLPVLQLMEYVLSDADHEQHPDLPRSGGYLTVDVGLDVDADVLEALRTELQDWVGREWQRLRGGSPDEQARPGVAGTAAAPVVELGTPTWTKGSVHLDAPTAPALVDARVAEGTPSLLGGNTASFSLDLTAAGADFVRQTLLGDDTDPAGPVAVGDTAPLQVGYDLSMWARLPAASVHISVDLRRTHEYVRRQWGLVGRLWCTGIWFAESAPTLDALTQTGAVTIQIDTGSGQIDEAVVQRLRDYALDMTKQVVASNVFSTSGQPATGGPQTFRLRDDDGFRTQLDSSASMVITVDLVQRTVVEWPVHPQGTLQGDLADLTPADRQQLVRRIHLDDPFYSQLDATVRAFADYGTAPGQVEVVEVQLAYPEVPTDGSAPLASRTMTLTSNEAQTWAPGLVDGNNGFSYRWRSKRAGRAAPDFGPWTESPSHRAVVLSVDSRTTLDLEVTSGAIDFVHVVAQCQVHLRYLGDGAGPGPHERVLLLTAALPTAHYTLPLDGPPTAPVEYRVGWLLLSGDVLEPGDWQDVPGNSLFLGPPPVSLLTLRVMPAGNAWADVASAVIEIQPAGATDATPVSLATLEEFRSLTFPVPLGVEKTYDHRRHVAYKSGRFEETPWTRGVKATDSAFLVVDLEKPGFDVVVDGTLLDLAAAPLTEVLLGYDGPPQQQVTLAFRTRGLQTWTVDAPSGAPVKVTWQVVHHPADRDAVPGVPVVEADTLVVLPPYRAAVAGEIDVDVVAALVRFDETPIVTVDLAYDDDENAYHQTAPLLFDRDTPARQSWRLPTKDARRSEFSYRITYFLPDGSPQAGPSGSSTVPRVVVPAHHA